MSKGRIDLRKLGWWVGVCLAMLPGVSVSAAHTRADLVFSHAVVGPGETIRVGVLLEMDPGWHTYWVNPGDSGGATKVRWDLPEGVEVGELEWPVPERYDVAGILTYVYHDRVLAVAPLTVAGDRPPGAVEIKAAVSWLECEEVCLPGEAEVTGTLEVGTPSTVSAEAELFEVAEAKLPGEGGEGWRAWWEGPPVEDRRGLVLAGPTEAESVDFYPLPGSGYDVGVATERSIAAGGEVRLRKEVLRLGEVWPEEVAGLLVEERGGERTGHRLVVEVGDEATAGADAEGASVLKPIERSLWLMLVFAFLGGLILNFMPCVLPVIALKVLSFVQQSRESPARVRRLGAVYGLGVLVSFVALAVVAIVVKEAGGMANWGMVLQHQVVRTVLTVVVTLVALNLFGLFEVNPGGWVMGAASQLSAKEGFSGAFLNGVLATVLATPCTAPFLSVALAFAFTQPSAVIMLFFLATGLGLAFPFVLLCWQPGWRRWMPRPGAWMERLKVAMGFPMLATALWLFWFTAPRFGKTGVLWLGLFLVLLAASAWTWGEFVQRGNRRRGVARVISLGLAVFGYVMLMERQLQWRAPTQPALAQGGLQEGRDGIPWEVWSPEAVVEARAAGRPVLVDFTADNCLNCQVNKITSLEIPATRAKLAEINAVALQGDFTDSDPRIASELQRFQRAGVPLVVVYPRDSKSEPIVLPPILTPGLVLDALERAAR